MAKQKGIVKLKGAIGDLSFYKSGDGYMAREKSGIDKNRFRNDPAFQRTRENGAEFGRAGKAGKLIRTAFRQLINVASDSRVTSRLTRELLKVIKSDPVNIRGERRMSHGDLNYISGFDFNVNSKLSSILFTGYETAIDRAAGSASVSLAEFIPQEHLAYPQGCTHIRLMAGSAEFDFEEGLFKTANVFSDDIPLSPESEAPVELSLKLTAGNTQDILLLLGIDFLQEVNGLRYPLKNGTYNALAIVGLSREEG